VRSMRTCVSRGNKLHGAKPCRWMPREKARLYVWRGEYRWELHCSGRHGIFAFAVLHRDDVRAGHGFLNQGKERPSMKRRTAKAELGDAVHVAPLETDRLSDCLPLVEHCAVRKYDDGSSREVGWLTIKTQGAAWVVQVKDPDSCCSFVAIGKTLDEALETASLLLSCDEAPWEPDTWLQQAAARKKRK